MDKKRLLLVATAVAVLGFIGLFAYHSFRVAEWMTPVTSEVPPSPVAPEKALTVEEELSLQSEMAKVVATKDYASCEAVANGMYRTACVNNIALNLARETGDIAHCAKIDDQLVSRSECERETVLSASLVKEDPSVCNQAGDERVRTQCAESFLVRLATKNQDVTVCDRAETESEKDDCHNRVTILALGFMSGKPLECGDLRGDDVRSDCALMQKALKALDARAANAPEQFADACGKQKSALFETLCAQADFMGSSFAR
jgi:hypothetical protein